MLETFLTLSDIEIYPTRLVEEACETSVNIRFQGQRLVIKEREL